MGCRETAVQLGARGRTSLRWTGSEIPGVKPGEALPGRWYEETLEPMGAGAHVVAQFAGGEPAAVVSRHGKGKTLMLGSYLSAAYETSPTPAVERFFMGLLQWAGVEPQVESAAENIEVRTLEAGADTLAFVFNHGPQPSEAAIGLRAAPGADQAADLVTGQSIPVTRSGEFLRFGKRLSASEVWVVRVGRQ